MSDSVEHQLKRRRVDEISNTTSNTINTINTTDINNTTSASIVPKFLSKAEREAAALARVAAKV
jgi:hypothetical protein